VSIFVDGDKGELEFQSHRESTPGPWVAVWDENGKGVATKIDAESLVSWCYQVLEALND